MIIEIDKSKIGLIESIETDEIREREEMNVYIGIDTQEKGRRLVVAALNEGGYNRTEVDLIDLLQFIKQNMPEIWQAVNAGERITKYRNVGLTE